MLNGIKVILFDLDNTLIDRNAAVLACIEQFFNDNMPQYYFENEQVEIEENDFWGYTPRTEFYEWFIQYYEPQGWDETSFWTYMQDNVASHVQPISEELGAILLHLKESYKIGILTNGSIINQETKIKNAQLDSYFSPEMIFISEQYEAQKPDETFFKIALNKYQIQASELLMVGDDPLNDILGAHQLGIKTCWISHNREWNRDIEPDYELNTVLDFPLLTS